MKRYDLPSKAVVDELLNVIGNLIFTDNESMIAIATKTIQRIVSDMMPLWVNKCPVRSLAVTT